MTRASAEDDLRFSFPGGELGRWAVLARVTAASVGVWYRDPAFEPQVARLIVDGDVVAEARVEPNPSHDGVVTVDLLPDRPRPGEPFRVDVGGLSRSGRFAPEEGAPAAFTFAFGSCHQPFEGGLLGAELGYHAMAGIYPRMEAELRRRDARFLLLVGDQIYSDGVSATSVRARLHADDGVTDDELIDIYRHLYRGYFNEPGFRSLNEAFPAYVTWDDHDIFDGWGSLKDPQPFDRRLFRAADVAYREYQHLRNPGGHLDGDPPYAYPFWYGDVGFFVLDLRGCRDLAAGRILGEAQWSMLDAFLGEADARGAGTVFIVASVPVIHFSPAVVDATGWLPGSKGTDVRDRWSVAEFRAEREALLERCFTWRAGAPGRQVVILSGDVHVGAAFRVRPRRRSAWPRGTIHQWTSSALTTPGGLEHRLVNSLGTALVNLGDPSVVSRRGGLDGYNNFGTVEVEPLEAGAHRLAFTLHEYDGRRDRLAAQFSVQAQPTRPRR